MNLTGLFRTMVFLVAMLLCGAFIQAQDEETNTSTYVEENQECMKCHGHEYFTYYNDWVERDVKERMNPYYIIDSALFYRSNHRNFKCVDCHSSDYETSFPHPNELRFEPQYTCMDCHEGDDNFAQFHFEKINEQFQESVHSENLNEEFTCWMCHNPHSYHISARNSENLLATIQYDNEICLGCHANKSRFNLLSDKGLYDILDRHEWLPNQRLHFQNVRCIECHAETNDTILVAHKILPKSQAVKKCVECHSRNSILMASLYRYQSQERRDNLGFFNAAILNDSYVIGANRNFILNMSSLVLFGFVILGIIIHAVLRKISK